MQTQLPLPSLLQFIKLSVRGRENRGLKPGHKEKEKGDDKIGEEKIKVENGKVGERERKIKGENGKGGE